MAKTVVVLDPGHYGQYNRGVSGLYYESVAMLKLSRIIRDKLNATEKIDCSLTRDNENDISLFNRGKIAADRGAFIFISEHTNACGTPSVDGTTVFYSIDLPGDKVWGEKFSATISQDFGTTDRGAKIRESTVTKGEDYYGVIDSSQDHGVPHCFIIESAFHTNVSDEEKLRQDEYLEKIADAQCKVICEMCGFSYGEAVPVLQPQPQPAPVINQANLAIQQKLNRLKITDNNGNALVEDGILGTKSKQAIIKFETICGLTVDNGIWGSECERAFQEIVSKPYCDMKNQTHKYAVRYIQWLTNAKPIDGLWGKITNQCVYTWQKKNGLVADMKFGNKSWQKAIG